MDNNKNKTKNMKTLYKLSFIIAITSFLVISCDTDDTTYETLNYPSDSFIALQTGSISVLESTTTPIEIIVFYANTTNGAKTAVSVDFSITSTNATEGVHYTIADNKSSLDFPVGTFSDTVTILPIDNLTEDGDKVLNFSLGSSSVKVGYLGPDTSGTSTTITLVDDDCAFTFADLDALSWIGTDNAPSGQGPNATQITTAFNGTDLLMEGIAYGWLTNLDYWAEEIVDSFPVIVDMDPVTGKFTIDEQPLCTTFYDGSIQDPYSISATGQYFSCLHSIVVNYKLYQEGGTGTLREFTETIEY